MPSYARLAGGYVHTADDNSTTNLAEVECGGGGNCLFLSLAYLLRLKGIDNNVTYTLLRGYAATVMTNWAKNFPVTLPAYLNPTNDFAVKIQRAGEWGDDTCIQAVIQHYSATAHFKVHVLVEGTGGGVMVFQTPTTVPAHTLYVILRGFRHYRALVTDAEVARVAPAMLVTRRPENVSSTKKELSGSLKLSTDGKQNTNTSNSETKIQTLEIHHIDVGQGDCALILLRDANNAIEQSVLIDTGPSGKEMAAYFDKLIANGDFRPIDIFVVSHYDADHIGGADVLFTEEELQSKDGKMTCKALKYVQPDVILYDQGDLSGDRDYTSYIKIIEKRGQTKQRQTALAGGTILDFEGVTIKCAAGNLFLPSVRKGRLYSMQSEEDVGMAEVQSELDVTVLSNARSLALVVEFGGFRYFTAGDLFGTWETSVARTIAGKKHVCVLKLGHHGAAEATTVDTLKLLRPRCGVISCGAGNTHGHPRQLTVNRLEELNKKYPCDYFITADVNVERDVLNGKYPTAKLPDKTTYGHNKQGSIIISVTSVQAAKHQFTVTTDTQNSQPLDCGERDYDEEYELTVEKLRTVRKKGPRSDQERLASQKRKQERLEAVKEDVAQYVKLKTKYRDFDFDELYFGEFAELFDQGVEKAAAKGEGGWEFTAQQVAKALMTWLKENEWEPSGDTESDKEEDPKMKE